jgi:hypothetical protein
MKKGITLSQVIGGFLLAATAERLSPHTIADYTNSFRKFQAFLGHDLPFGSIKVEQMRPSPFRFDQYCACQSTKAEGMGAMFQRTC